MEKGVRNKRKVDRVSKDRSTQEHVRALSQLIRVASTRAHVCGCASVECEQEKWHKIH